MLPKTAGPPYRPQNTTVLFTGTPKKEGLVLGNPQIDLFYVQNPLSSTLNLSTGLWLARTEGMDPYSSPK